MNQRDRSLSSVRGASQRKPILRGTKSHSGHISQIFSLDLSELRSSIADRVKKLGELSKW